MDYKVILPFEIKNNKQALFWEVRACMWFFRKRAKKGKIFENLEKVYEILKYFEKEQVIVCNYQYQHTTNC